jgi:hypothetical protein
VSIEMGHSACRCPVGTLPSFTASFLEHLYGSDVVGCNDSSTEAQPRPCLPVLRDFSHFDFDTPTFVCCTLLYSSAPTN